MGKQYEIPLAIGVIIVITAIITSYLIFFTEDNGNGGHTSEPNVTIDLTSDAKVYSVEETIILYYYIKNNEASNLSLEKYLICIDLVIGPNRVERLYELTKTLKPGEEVNDSIEINRDLEPGEHLFNMELLEIMGENRYLLHQSKRLVIRIE